MGRALMETSGDFQASVAVQLMVELDIRPFTDRGGLGWLAMVDVAGWS